MHKIALAGTHVTTHTMKNKWTRVEKTIEFAKGLWREEDWSRDLRRPHRRVENSKQDS